MVWHNPVSNEKDLEMSYNFQYSNAGLYPYRGRAQYRRQGSCLRSLFVFVVVVAVLGIGGTFIARNTILVGPTTISVSALPTLVIDSQANNGSTFTPDTTSIHIHAANTGNKIILQALNPYGIPLSLSVPIPYDRSGDGSTVIIDVDSLQSSRIDVTVPADTNLKSDTNSKNIEVDGVTGQMVLTSNSGSITVTNSTLSASSLLANNQFLSNSGSIDVTFPRHASFHLNATVNSANSASITTDFPGLSVKNAAIHANLGRPPRAQVTFYSNGGSIKLHAQ